MKARARSSSSNRRWRSGNSKSLSTLAQDHRPDLSICLDRCMRVRYTRSTCSRCLSVCPANAITLDPGPSISSACSECGLCRTACPTDVFETIPATDHSLLGQARLVLNAHRKFVGREKLVIRCQEAQTPNERSLAVACLGAISENTLVGAAVLRFAEVVLVRGDCRSCSLRHGEELLENSIRNSQSLMQTLDLKTFNVRLVERPKQRAASVGRREIFSAIGDRLRTSAVAAAIDRESAVPDEELLCEVFAGRKRRSAPSRRSLLRRIIADASLERLDPSRCEATLPWGKLSIDEQRCTACGICASVCPARAIVLRADADRRVFSLWTSVCTNCDLCQEACREGAISFPEKLSIADFLNHEPEIAVSVTLGSCTVCGDSIPAKYGTTCPTCERRHLSRGLTHPRDSGHAIRE